MKEDDTLPFGKKLVYWAFKNISKFHGKKGGVFEKFHFQESSFSVCHIYIKNYLSYLKSEKST